MSDATIITLNARLRMDMPALQIEWRFFLYFNSKEQEVLLLRKLKVHDMILHIRIAIACLLLLLTSVYLNAQTITWQRTYGTTIEDKGYSVVQTNDNGFIFCGSQFISEPTRIIRTDSLGNVLWSKNESGRIYSKIIRDNDMFILVGVFSNNAYAIKLDLTGKKIWQRAFGVPYTGLFCDVILTSDNEYIFVGLINNSGPISNIFMIKADTSGSIIWEKTIDSVANCVKVEELASRGYLISSKESVVTNKNFENGTSEFLGSKTIITDPHGDPQFIKSGIGRSGVPNFHRTGVVLFENRDTLNTTVVRIIRTDNMLNVVSTSVFYEPGHLLTASSLIRNGSDYVLAGQTILFGNGDQDPYLVKFNDSDKILMKADIPVRYEFNEYISSLTNCTDKGFMAVGATSPFIGDNVDLIAIKTDSLGNTIPVSISSGNSFQVNEGYRLFQNYPNPFNPVSTIKFDIRTSGNVSMKVFDVLGNEVVTLVNEVKNAGRHEVEFNAGNLPSGVYFYSLNVDGKQMGVKRMALVK
ncbi:MAG: T9SS type A sorting domain-containing protein [Ignavibacteria bacterium]|nr:T9SS type A sorting domain-containing protein [Ignavibacteria bacterium]